MFVRNIFEHIDVADDNSLISFVALCKNNYMHLSYSPTLLCKGVKNEKEITLQKAS